MRALAPRPGRLRLLRRGVVVLAAVPALASAQQPVAAADELTQAILRYAFRYGGGNARLIPGRVPEDLAPNFHAPPGTRILGTVITNAGAVVLATTTTAPESLRAEYTRALGPRGWKSPETMGRGGFVASSSDLPVLLCRGDSQLHVQHTRRATGVHDLHLEYRDGSGMCDDMSPRVVFEPEDRPRFPTLHAPPAPPGTSVSSCYPRLGRRRGSSSIGTSTVVPSSLSATDLLRHYGRQLEGSGWQPPGREGGPSLITGTWVRTDSAGTSRVTLEVREGAPGSGCYEVEMKVAK